VLIAKTRNITLAPTLFL